MVSKWYYYLNIAIYFFATKYMALFALSINLPGLLGQGRCHLRPQWLTPRVSGLRSLAGWNMAENSIVVPSSKFSSGVDELKFNSVEKTKGNNEVFIGTLEDYYDVLTCVKCIKDGMFKKVALQFPDFLLSDSPKVAQIIEEQANCKTYVLADTSYGSCCVDEIAAEHVKADLIIHFGPTCLSPTERIPVLFIFGKASIDINCCCPAVQNAIPDKNQKILMIYDVPYHYAIDKIYSELSSEYKHLVLASVNYPDPKDFSRRKNGTRIVEENSDRNGDNRSSQECGRSFCCPNDPAGLCFHRALETLSLDETSRGCKRYCRFGRTFTVEEGFSVGDYVVFYIGKESLTLINHMMTYNKCQFHSYDPEKNICRKETLNVNRSLMKRYYLIERAKDAQVVGILVGTLGIASYLSVIFRIKQILRHCGKKYYTFVVGKLNAEKLANFMEIDVFVLIACPENSLINSQEFYKPIVTPFEIEIACTKARQWTGEYITDFRELLPGAAHHVEIDNQEDEVDDIPDVSLISGQLRPVYHSSKQGQQDSNSNTLAQRNQDTALSTRHTSAVEFLSKRSWKGLDPRRGETAVSEVVEGRKGIAVGYSHEPRVEDGT